MTNIETFVKYAFCGDLDEVTATKIVQELGKDDNSIELDDDREDTDGNALKRQYYTFVRLQQNPEAAEGTKFLLSKLESEIKTQYDRKSQIETRAGFLMALWGIILTASYDTLKDLSGNIIAFGIVFALITAICALSLGNLCACMWSSFVFSYDFADWNSNIVTALDYQEVMLARMLEGYKGAYDSNEKSIKNKSKRLNLAVVFVVVYVLVITCARILSVVMD